MGSGASFIYGLCENILFSERNNNDPLILNLATISADGIPGSLLHKMRSHKCKADNPRVLGQCNDSSFTIVINDMRQIIVLVLLIFSVTTSGQGHKWQLSLQLQPEFTFHKDGYPWWKENNNKSTLNVGVGSTVQFNLNRRFFISSGLGYISRTLHTANFLNQAALPPPKQSFTMELVTTKSVTYRVISFPLNAGYNFISTNKFRSFVTTGFSGNYLLNTCYKSNFSKYDGAYKKNYWQGYSLTFGLGTDFALTEKLLISSTLSYAFKHQVKEDEYISNQHGTGLTLGHKYLSLGVGIKFPL